MSPRRTAKTPPLKPREVKRRVSATLAKLHDRKPKSVDEKAKPEPKSGNLSHQKPTSKNALFYQPHRAKDVKFRDTRDDVMEVKPTGALNAVTKPLSRVKRQRLVRKTIAEISAQAKKRNGGRPKGKDPK